jgi:hypothetical protein
LKKCSEYYDDCGACRQGGNSTKPAYFIRSAQNSLHFVTYRASIYCKMSKGNFVPLGLQPDSSTIVVAYRNSSYKKRVTWFNSEPVIATAIAEYIGEYVPSVVHGNAQHACTTVPYRSLTSHQKSILREGIQHGKAPREIRRDVNTATPADIISNRVAQNARYYQHKKDRPEST